MLFLKSLVVAVKLLVVCWVVFLSCSGKGGQESTTTAQHKERNSKLEVPVFNQDTAYAYIAKQVSFGPRVPNTTSHEETAVWLESTLSNFADTVIVQKARVRAYDNTILNLKNIIASFAPEKRNRVLLCAHWDTRPFADWDPDPANHYKPIPGANDGGSGVGVLLEIARLLADNKPEVGIDIILFDGEDYGKHESLQRTNDDNTTWALGSQHWARNPHVNGYSARFGILLDMVGAQNAKFKHERFSLQFAPNIVRKVWAAASRIGFQDYFLNIEGNHVIDDHYFINTLINIPTINIIHQESNNTTHGFFPYWHTMADDLDKIDPMTLKAVGQTVLTVIYEEK